MTPHIPARRAAALRHGGAMAPATLSTQAPAARKRGGGPLRRVLLAASLAGRPSKPEGGAIKNLCCAAAGLFLSPPQAHADVAYPTTSVRRGAEDAASLRFPLAPHAQLVEGYKHLGQETSKPVSCLLNLLTAHPKGKKCSLRATRNQLIEKVLLTNERQFQVQHSLRNRRAWRVKNIEACKLKCLALNHGLNVRPVTNTSNDAQRAKKISHVIQNRQHCYVPVEPYFLVSLNIPLLRSSVGCPRDPHGSQNRRDRSNRLHPSRQTVAGSRGKHHHLQPPAQRPERKEPPNHPHACQLHAFRHLKSLHSAPLQAMSEDARLPVDHSQVQGVAT